MNKNKFGIAVMHSNVAKSLENLQVLEFWKYTDKNGILVIDLHIAVAFGTNINTIAKSVAHKVKFAVSQSVRNSKCRVNVFIDDIKS